MKTSLLIALLSMSVTAFAQTTATKARRAPATEAPLLQQNAAQLPSVLSVGTTTKMHFATNVVGLTKSVGNASIDFFGSDKLSANFRFNTSSAKEYKKKVDAKIPTDRNAFGLGGTFWAFGSQSVRNILVNPYLAFGTKKDQYDVETLSGFGMKVSGLVRLTPVLTAELGLIGDNLDDGNMKGDIFVGAGFLF